MTPGWAGCYRWYPRAWRERYGEEFLAMVEDTLAAAGCGSPRRGLGRTARPGRRFAAGTASGLRRGAGIARARPFGWNKRPRRPLLTLPRAASPRALSGHGIMESL